MRKFIFCNPDEVTTNAVKNGTTEASRGIAEPVPVTPGKKPELEAERVSDTKSQCTPVIQTTVNDKIPQPDYDFTDDVPQNEPYLDAF